MKLYHLQNTRSVRPRWLLLELGVPHEIERVLLWEGAGEAPEYKKIHPMGAVPALVDGDVTIFESAAICLYLADKYPEKGLAPAIGTKDRAYYYQWMMFAMATLEGPIIDYYAATVQTPEESRNPAEAADAMARFRDAADVLEAHLQGRDWLLGAQFTAADVVTVSLVAWARLMGVLTDYPVLEAYMKRGAARPANKAARAD